MPTLSLEGSVYHADSLDRRQLIQLAPSVEVTHLVNRIRTQIDDADEHAISLSDLPDDKASVVMFYVSNGSADVTIVDDNSDSVTFTDAKILFMLDTTITGITITGAEDSTVYDLLLGANAG